MLATSAIRHLQMRKVRRAPPPRSGGCCGRRLRPDGHAAEEHKASMVFDMTVHGCGHGAVGLGDQIPTGGLLASGPRRMPRKFALSALCSEVCKLIAQRDSNPSYPGVCER
jgi:hypothetical protein